MAALPLAVIYKFVDDEGAYLAALLTYYGFVSLFPLLLLAVTILGFVLTGNPAAQQAVVNSALRNFPVIGDQIASNVHSIHGNVTALVVGIVVSLYGGLARPLR
jgi:membrane protein